MCQVLALTAAILPPVAHQSPLPSDAAIAEITAIVRGIPLLVPKSATFKVPREHYEFLRLFRPLTQADYPRRWDNKPLAELRIKTKAGALIVIIVPFSGKVPLKYSVDGQRFIRGGKYAPIYEDAMYLSECIALANLLLAIHDGGDRESLAPFYENFERSAGLREPIGASGSAASSPTR